MAVKKGKEKIMNMFKHIINKICRKIFHSFKQAMILISSFSLKLLLRSNFHYLSLKMMREPLWLKVHGKSCRIYGGNLKSNFDIYNEVILEDIYGMFEYSKKSNPALIVDIGAHVGMFSKLCGLLFPDVEIHAYEPYLPVLEWLERNSEGTCIKVFPYAVENKSSSVMLDTDCSPGSTMVSLKGKLVVKCVAASEVAKGRKIDLVKMDCEGSEWSILQDIEFLKRIKDLRMEYHLYDNHTLQELQDLIERAGHRILCIKKLNPVWPDNKKLGVLWSTNKHFSE
jgi:FkbM family methyltransferase